MTPQSAGVARQKDDPREQGKYRVNAMIARTIRKILFTRIPVSAKIDRHRSVCGKRLRRRDAGREMAPAMASAISAQAVIPCTKRLIVH
jgi:hypothetical protein